jgi:carbamoylphosphate synthase small subunit
MAGEIVFNTAITGYQEVITDPSYRGQIVTMLRQMGYAAPGTDLIYFLQEPAV